MPARIVLPDDDLYARLELPADATPEAIEIAWRALLKRHHPDVAGAEALDTAKRINVAHDWLADPILRARYDVARWPALRLTPSRGSAARDGASARRGAPARTGRPSGARPRPVADPAEALERFVDRVARLDRDALDRLSLADPRPVAFVASIRRFLPDERIAAVEAAEAAIAARVAPAAWADPPTRDALLGYAHELVLGTFLDQHLSEPFRTRVRDRLTRGWEAAIDQPRYGPNTNAVRRFLDRVSHLTEAEARALADSRHGRLGTRPWPSGLDPDEDDGLRVSSDLATRDAEAIPLPRTDHSTAARARRILGATGHALVLRHGFSASEYADLTAAWRVATGDPGTGRASPPGARPTVRRG